MARKFLVAIDLGTNELQNAVIQNLSAAQEPTGVKGRVYFDSTNNVIKVYNGTVWKAIATGGEAATTVTLTGDVTGTGNVSSGTITVDTIVGNDSHSHSTSTLTGIQEFVEDTVSTMITGATHSGISVSYNDNAGAAGTLAFTNTGVTSITGTTNEITISGTGSDPYTGAITIGLPDDVTIGGDLIVTGDLTVNGDVTTLNTATMNVEDNIFVLNSNVTGTPAANAGLEVERGSYTNSSLFWNESENKWYVGQPADNTDAAVETAISLVGHGHSVSDISGIQEYIEDTVATSFTDSGTIDFTYSDNGASAGTISAAVILATSNSFLNTTSGLAVDKSSLQTAFVSDGFTKKYAGQNASLTPDGGAVSWVVTHSLGTLDVQVQVYDLLTKATVEVDVTRNSTSQVTLTWNSATTVSADSYRVVVIG